MISLDAITDRDDVQAALSLLAERVANHVLSEHCPDATARYHMETEDEVREVLESSLRSLAVDSYEEAVAEQMMAEGAAAELDCARELL